MTTDQHKALHWIATGRVGVSSKAIAMKMAGMPIKDPGHPHDPDDLNRCLLLLNLYPEWRRRIGEMATVSPYWAALAERWEDIERTFLDEVGLDWSKGQKAKRTYKLMRAILDPIETADQNVFRLGKGVTVSFGGRS